MPAFSPTSDNRLNTCHPDLQRVMRYAIQHIDLTVISGHRTKEQQDELFRTGKSQLRGGASKHNASPSLAVDVIPWPVDWSDREQFTYFAGFIMGIAASMGIELRWGGDWNRDTRLSDNSFDDLAHFELVETEKG